ncbi:hypothetical protein RclHR1_08180003 [Rhizophagus clarus]|uniref:Carbohydrate-binding module family 50 protein n=1 Tax=Rhizophagus clarus TaxID=94130 RepID=A0A2Z6SN03_9GLOM|nr:hypothetical protein RclHR1_08180003 [Rhizophagus clarus]GES87186.1 carbohydrate-binding module family 50 protein [Rhizophagus clarus]
MENNNFQNWSVNDAPPRVFFPPKTSLTKELEYKKKRPILEHISTSIGCPHKLALKPTTSHPLNHQITTSPITPPFFKKFHKNDELLLISKLHSSPKIDGICNEIVQQNINGDNLRKRSSIPDISINTNLKNSLLKEVDNNEKKMVIVHEVKPSDTIAGVALFYGIEISILKKANKLWTNDSIHLRKFLYIPIDQCSIIDDETKVVVQDDHISIKTNRSFSDNIIRPSISPTSAFPTPFTIYERELLFCTLPEHANYVNSNHSNHNHNLHLRQSSQESTSNSSIWSATSSSSSISSTASNNCANNFTRAEIQQLPADQLTYFPSKKSNSSEISNTLLTTPTLPSPSPVSHLNRHKQHCSIPLSTMRQDSAQNSNLDNIVKDGTRRDILSGIYNTELLSSLNKVRSKKDPRFFPPTFIRNASHI